MTVVTLQCSCCTEDVNHWPVSFSLSVDRYGCAVYGFRTRESVVSLILYQLFEDVQGEWFVHAMKDERLRDTFVYL